MKLDWRRQIAALFATAVLNLGAAKAEELVIPGSGNPEYVLGQLAKAFNAKQTQHRIIVPPSSGMAGAVRDVSEGVSSLGRTGRPLREAEAARGLVYVPIGREAVAVVGGAGVTAREVTSDQLRGVLSGQITDWRELGGSRAPIRLLGKESTDAIRTQIAQFLKDLSYTDAMKIVHLDPQLIELLDRYPSSFSVMNRSALGACQTKVVTLTLDGVESTVENVENGRYPLTVEYGLVHRTSGMSPAGKAFLAFIRSPEGAKILRSHNVLPKS